MKKIRQVKLAFKCETVRALTTAQLSNVGGNSPAVDVNVIVESTPAATCTEAKKP